MIGDPTRLRQIFFNLIGNAIKFIKEGGDVSITIEEYKKTETTSDFFLRGIVSDTGIGMTPETLAHLFKKPFYQAETSMMRQYGGTGLGLHITKKLCEIMGGSIEATSQIGVGSTFQFSVKMNVPEKKNIPILRNSPEKSKKPGDLPKLNVLIAEDNRVNQLYLKAILNKFGCTTTVVENGSEAVTEVQNEHYDLVLMDGEMPIMDGLEATRIIREKFNYQSLPIIGVTAHGLDTHKKFLKAGMDDCIIKPFTKDTLKDAILRCLDKAHTP